MRDEEYETRAELLRYLEQVSGRALRTRKDVDAFLEFYAEVHPQKQRREALDDRWLVAKRLVLALLAAFAVFQYFAVETVTEVLTIDRVKFLTPPPQPRTART